jgi:hypothetical protein
MTMKTFILRYEDDPPMPVVLMTRPEFLAAYPRRPIRLSSLDGTRVTEIPVGEDEIACDHCNADPGETIYVYAGLRSYCQKCYEKCWARYCVPLGHD